MKFTLKLTWDQLLTLEDELDHSQCRLDIEEHNEFKRLKVLEIRNMLFESPEAQKYQNKIMKI